MAEGNGGGKRFGNGNGEDGIRAGRPSGAPLPREERLIVDDRKINDKINVEVITVTPARGPIPPIGKPQKLDLDLDLGERGKPEKEAPAAQPPEPPAEKPAVPPTTAQPSFFSKVSQPLAYLLTAGSMAVATAAKMETSEHQRALEALERRQAAATTHLNDAVKAPENLQNLLFQAKDFVKENREQIGKLAIGAGFVVEKGQAPRHPVPLPEHEIPAVQVELQPPAQPVHGDEKKNEPAQVGGLFSTIQAPSARAFMKRLEEKPFDSTDQFHTILSQELDKALSSNRLSEKKYATGNVIELLTKLSRQNEVDDPRDLADGVAGVLAPESAQFLVFILQGMNSAYTLTSGSYRPPAAAGHGRH